MSNLFDSYQNGVFDRVTNIMGRDAIWIPMNGDPTQTGRVLLNEPTEQEMIDKASFNPRTRRMEYKDGVFTGLFERVQRNYPEEVEIDSVMYVCSAAEAKFDGKTYTIIVDPI